MQSAGSGGPRWGSGMDPRVMLLVCGLGGLPQLAWAELEDFDAALSRTVAKYGAARAVPAASVAWLASAYGRTPEAVGAALAAVSGDLAVKPLAAGRRAGEAAVNALGMELRWIPPGRFTMGCSPGDEACTEYESPPHPVELVRGFWMGRTEVTQAEWQTVMGSNPSKFQGGTPDDPRRPVETVSLVDAQAYLAKLTERERRVGRLAQDWSYRLPSEAEWEYAARAGTTGSRYGDLEAIAWCSINSASLHPRGDNLAASWKRHLDDPQRNEEFRRYARRVLAAGVVDAKASTHPVGLKRANPWGLHDMLGNVSEWCQDRMHASYAGAPADGSVWAAGSFPAFVIRGGSWLSLPWHVTASKRAWSGADVLEGGFRVVASPTTR